MRQVSAKLVGSVVLIAGACTALAAGVLLPVLGGVGGRLMRPSGSTIPVADTDIEAAAPHDQPDAFKSAARERALPLSGAALAASRMPADADVVLVIEDAAELRRSQAGAAVERFLTDASGLAQTRAAWTALAAQLGWSETEAFDRLLGRRVVLVARGLGDAQTARWALLSDVSLETDQRLKERLEASQRALDHGHQILSVEKGKYELTSHRRERSRPAPASATGCGDDVTIVLGPAGRSDLFDQMVGVLADGGTNPLDRRPVIRAAAEAGSPEILFLARRGSAEALAAGHATPTPATHTSPAAAGDDRWADFILVAGGRAPGKADGSEFAARVVYRDHRQREANLAITPTSDVPFRRLAPDSLLTIMQAAPVQQILGDAARLLDAARDLPLPESAHNHLGTRRLLSLRLVTPPGGVAPLTPDASTAAARTPTPRPRLSAVLALDSTGPDHLAPILDAAITRFIAAREQLFGITRPPPHDFGGRLPAITRILPIELPEPNPLRLFVADPLTLAWSFPRDHHAPAPTTQVDEEVGGQSSHAASTLRTEGWCILSVTPTPPGLESLPEHAHNQTVEALTGHATPDLATQPPDTRRWVWLGFMRPRDLEKRLPSPSLVPDVGGFRSAMKRFDAIRVELSINPSGDIQGDLHLRLDD